MSNGKLIKDSNEIINELMSLIQKKDEAIERYKEINETNKIIINGYKESVDTLMETVRKKDKLIDSLMQNTDGQYETTQVLLNKVKELQSHIENLKKIRPN